MIKNLKFNQNSKFKIQNFKLKSFPKTLTIFFLTVFILQMICVFFLLATPVASQAAVSPGDFAPQTPNFLEDLNYKFNKNDPSTGNIANLVRAVYNYAIGIVGILAAVVLMVGGVLWIVAGGNSSQVSEAKAWIGAALTGLVLALTSYLILTTVNPALVDLKTTNITKVGKAPGSLGCCKTYGYNAANNRTISYENTTAEACDQNTAPPNSAIVKEFDKTGTCPTPCCLYNLVTWSNNNGWKGCNDSLSLTKEDCEKLGTTSTLYNEPNNRCEKDNNDNYSCKKR